MGFSKSQGLKLGPTGEALKELVKTGFWDGSWCTVMNFKRGFRLLELKMKIL